MRSNPLTQKAMTQEQYDLWMMSYSFDTAIQAVTDGFKAMVPVFAEMAEAFAGAFRMVGSFASDVLDTIEPHRIVRREVIEAGEHPALAEGWL